MKSTIAFVLVAIAVLVSPWGRTNLRRGVSVLLSWRATDSLKIRDDYLKSEATVEWDENGTPHVQASCLPDLYFTQGYAHALDRLWQMETRRSIARGKLAEKFGAKAISLDVFTRTVGFEQAARNYLDRLEHDDTQLGKETLDALRSYGAGINAGVQSLSVMPLEFLLARVEWKKWEELDTLSFALYMQYTLEFGWKQETTMSALRDILDDEGMSYFGFGQERVFSYTVPTLPQNWTFSQEETKKKGGKEQGLRKKVDEFQEKRKERKEEELGELVEEIGVIEGGSNAWVVSGKYTETGMPHLANDPHLEVTFPNVWYHMYLSSPELKVSGASIPGLPAILIGHNDHIGWGITVTSSDSCDVFEEKVDKEKGVYEFNGEQRELKKEVFSISVKGEENYNFTRYSTHHGPLISEIMPRFLFNGENTEYSLASSSLQTFGSLEGFCSLNFCKNYEEFRQALSHFSGHLNIVYGDVEGNIGYQLTGKIPIRQNKAESAGMFPSRGWTGDNEWEGYIPFNQLPRSYNPKEGFIVTANSYPVGEWYPHHLGRTFVVNSRARRIQEVLVETIQNGEKVSMETSRLLQVDVLDVYARDVLPYLLPLFQKCSTENGACAEFYQEFSGWNSQLVEDSIPATLWQIFKEKFMHKILEEKGVTGSLRDSVMGLGPHHLAASSTMGQLLGKNVVEIIKQQGGSLLPLTKFEQFIRDAASETLRECRENYGEKGKKWEWGQIHTFRWPHPLSSLPVIGNIFDLGTYPFSGSSDTPLQSSSKFGTYEANSFVPSFRHILDFSEINKSKFLNAPGQSGHPLHDHAADHIEHYLKGELLKETH